MLLGQLCHLPGFRRLWLRSGWGSLEERTRFDVWPRPSYAYGVWRAGQLAKSLHLPGITVAEFGVAGGSGLLALEDTARQMAAFFGITIDVLGFDSGNGMPPPADFRDLPHVWAEGFYRMDEPKLRARLKQARLLIGDLSATVPQAMSGLRHPLGFVSFDLDYYSSTIKALAIFEGPQDSRLPRVFCFFDDMIWPERACHNEYTGEAAAIREFNDCHGARKICRIEHLRWMRKIPSSWNEQMHVLHDFDHPLYTRNVTPAGEKHTQLKLRA
jgi:hypothetical protein